MADYKHVDPDLLIKMYVTDCKSTHQIAKELNISQRQIYIKISRLNIIDPNRKHDKTILKRKYGTKLGTNDGYIKIYLPEHSMARKDGFILEHRLIVSKSIGRGLLPSEVVHHKNELRADNRLENLELYASPGKHCCSQHRPAKSDEQLILEIKDLYKRLNRPVKCLDLKPSNGTCSYETYRVHFGSWKVAAQKAGVPYTGSRHAPA